MLSFKQEHPVWYWLLTRIGFTISATLVGVIGTAAVLSMILIFITAAYNNQWIYFLWSTPVLFFTAYCFLELAMFLHDRF